jgi:hypothetical protein
LRSEDEPFIKTLTSSGATRISRIVPGGDEVEIFIPLALWAGDGIDVAELLDGCFADWTGTALDATEGFGFTIIRNPPAYNWEAVPDLSIGTNKVLPSLDKGLQRGENDLKHLN